MSKCIFLCLYASRCANMKLTNIPLPQLWNFEKERKNHHARNITITVRITAIKFLFSIRLHFIPHPLKILKIEDIFLLKCLKFYYNLRNKITPHYFLTIFEPARILATRQANGATYHNSGTRTLGADQCLQSKILRDIDIGYDRNVIDKVTTHSYQGFSNYAKHHILDEYISACPLNGVNCYICNRPPWP